MLYLGKKGQATEMHTDLNRLRRKKLFLFDIDGTLAVGDTLYEGSAELLAYIDAIGGKAYYITNNSTRSGQDYVEKFRRAFRLETTEDQFITSGYMTLRFLQEHFPQGKIFFLGTASFIAELRKNGLCVTETAEGPIDCIVAAYDSELTYEKLIQACRALSTTDAPFYGTNPDLRRHLQHARGCHRQKARLFRQAQRQRGRPMPGSVRLFQGGDSGGGGQALH